MLCAIFWVLLTSVIFTFFPSLGGRISSGLQRAWGYVRTGFRA